MPEKINLDYLKVRYCGFENYELMTMFLVGAPQKKKTKQIPVIKQLNTSNALF